MTDNTSVGLMSDGPIDGFDGGWAIIPFMRKPHLWHAITDEFYKLAPEARDHGYKDVYQSACGVIQPTTAQVHALGPGNHPLCKRCQKAAQ